MVHDNAEITNRLSKIEGQVRGVKAMLDAGRPCEDLLIQLSSISASITGVAKTVLSDHIHHCVAEGRACGLDDGCDSCENSEKCHQNEEKMLAKLDSMIEQFAKMK